MTISAAAYGAAVGRKVDLDDLVGAREIGVRLNVTPNMVHDWRRRHLDFPDPVAQLGGGLIWLWPEVEAWAKDTGRQVPPKRKPRQ